MQVLRQTRCRRRAGRHGRTHAGRQGVEGSDGALRQANQPPQEIPGTKEVNSPFRLSNLTDNENKPFVGLVHVQDILVLALGRAGEGAGPGLTTGDRSVGVGLGRTARAPGAGPGRLPRRIRAGPNRTASHALGLGLR